MISPSEIRRLFNYDANTGAFYAAVKRGRHSKAVGERVGVRSDGVCPSIWIGGRLYKVSHLAWLYVHGYMPSCQIDHINRNPADNRIANLRLASPGQNKANFGTYRNNKLGIKNVRRKRGAYEVRCSSNKQTIGGGTFVCLGAAVKAAAQLRRELHGEFACSGMRRAANE